uniref:L1 transposable element RRM domain-containing protein n=1 Tax=Cyprinus carpio TaxID=7962 RepID=A0A8C1V351_CYPCA
QDNVKEVEQRINKLEEREDVTTELLKKLVKEQKEMSEKIEYLENKSRQNNIRIYGIQEGLETNDTIGFVTTLLIEKLDIPPDIIQIVAAHHSLAQRPARNATPRTMVIRFMQWNTRQRVLQAAWSKKEIRIGESRIYFSQDFPNKIQKELSRYFQLRKVLKEKNVKSHIIYPSKLRVFIDGNAPYHTVMQLVRMLSVHSVQNGTLEEADLELQNKVILQNGDEIEPQPRRATVRRTYTDPE